ncbi:hypothetical protein Mucpa_3044 [Mucilaginibacter paludis DSM 18603]|uniref:Uncharacterized protein n=1 Tax=Mucilaginibacter paludis DSM 18603 TaxID=714943 RepID=H1YDC3_9SPHI|nr:hypothetical protein Mucpa_3044 [Mucilaginibacter paludis DSM 18603]
MGFYSITNYGLEFQRTNYNYFTHAIRHTAIFID